MGPPEPCSFTMPAEGSGGTLQLELAFEPLRGVGGIAWMKVHPQAGRGHIQSLTFYTAEVARQLENAWQTGEHSVEVDGESATVVHLQNDASPHRMEEQCDGQGFTGDVRRVEL